ncbi:MAG: ubiquinol oxidase subunit II [Solidesulfovibrio sp.]|uniref:ubiquinol oxidase subunit II n=1 Tax=Solidesulfovibrio sp. TaxID=2910990 RepID=UPI002B211CC0|nr:ubiquinol oxidase subunit II [Solidesulfovibrio sp.]MEA4858403.1 ubiquinol oxidase subunit II [Solidesulfovibrio sp.]
MKKKVAFGRGLLLAGLALALEGCSHVALLDPKGPVGEAERTMILIAFGLMLLVVVPVIVMAVWFPLKYRESNTKAAYEPEWGESRKIETVMWLIPLAIVVALSAILWRETHRLDPYKPLAGEGEPVEVEVVSLDWKWLFIYPRLGIATVNDFVFPAKAALGFSITSDTVMTSFFIPRLGSQIYAMGGMRTRLHLLASEEGDYVGQNQQFSGAGYPDMIFRAKAVSREAFAAWLAEVRQSPRTLDAAAFEELRRPGVPDGPIRYSAVAPGLFDRILNQYDPLTKHAGHGAAPRAPGHAGHAD